MNNLERKIDKAIALLKEVIEDEDEAAYFLGTDRLDKIKRLIDEQS